MTTPKRRRSKTFKLMEEKGFVSDDIVIEDKLTLVTTNLDYDAKSPSTSRGDDENDEEDYVVLDLYNSGDLTELDKTFGIMENALLAQKEILTSKWELISDKKCTDNGVKIEKSLLIDLKHILERISRIGMLRGKQFEELESEQNSAIEKLSSVVDLEEEARISRNRAIEIQKETELEMKEIDCQREIISSELKKAEPDLLAARLAVEDINDRALNELISLKKPPSTVTNVLTVAVWIVNSVENDNGSNNSKGKQIVALKSSSSETTSRTKGSKYRGRTRTAESVESASARFGTDRAKTPKTPKTPRGTKSKKRITNTVNKFKGKRNRAVSTGLQLKNESKNESKSESSQMKRSKTPMSNHSSKISLSPLSESQSQVKKRSKSKIVIRSKDKNNNRKNKNSMTPKHKKSGSRIDKLKSRNFQKILTQPWSDTRIMLTRGNFKKSVLAFDPKQLDKKVCARLENEFLKLEDFTVLRANQASKVLGPLVKWIRSIVGYTQIWYRIEPLANKVSELEMALDVKKLEVKRLKSISKESHEKVIKIRSEMLKMVGYHKIGKLYFLS